MNRRDFLKHSLAAAALTGTGIGIGIGLRPASALAGAGLSYGRTVINVMLRGGADLRYLFVPHPTKSKDYAQVFWDARKAIYTGYPSYSSVWNDLYKPVERNGVSFGIHKAAGWLAERFAAGEAAIVANVGVGDNRDHAHGQLIADAGDPLTQRYLSERDGWGGRLIEAIGNSNAVAVTNTVSVFCLGTNPANRTAGVIHAPDSRDLALAPAIANQPTTNETMFARALTSYYTQKGREIGGNPANWPYHRFFEHFRAVRQFGDAVNQRFAEIAPVQPRKLRDLYTAGSGNTLGSRYFGMQCASIYDSLLVSDLFRLRAGSMALLGWDTHKGQKGLFEPLIEDVFGDGKGLATLTGELASLGADDDVVFVFNSDFGRQLAANGSAGTDHGRGNYMIVVGRGVRGGVYGEMFPEAEIAGGAGNRLYDGLGSDIRPLTSFQRVLSSICDWVEPGTGAQVVPGASTSALEPGSDVGNLMKG